MSRLRILHLITGLETGGAQTSLCNLVSAMAPDRFENVVVSMTTVGHVGQQLQERGFDVHALGMRRGVPDPRGLFRLRRLISEVAPDVLQSWLYHADLLATLAAKTMRFRPFAWNIRCSAMQMHAYGILSGLTLRALVRLSHLPDVVVVNSRAGRAAHESLGFHPLRWELIPNGIDPERFKPDAAARAEIRRELRLNDDALLVGIVARYDPMKDYATFIAAAAEISKTCDVHFVMAGSGVRPDNAALRAAIGAAGLEARAHLLGCRTDIPRVLAALDLACSTSSFGEGFPNAIAEAMACAVPCVVTDVGDSAWLLGTAGLVVAAKDPIAFASAANQLIESGRERRQKTGEAGRRRIVEHFNLPGTVRHYEELYASMTLQRIVAPI